MIVFDLKCANGHVFEEWFTNTAEYEAQQKAGELACPDCGDTRVTKGLSAPAVAGTGSSEPEPAPSCGLPTGGCSTGMCPMG